MIRVSRDLGCCMAVVMLGWAPTTGADSGLDACVGIDDDATRLGCYDQMAGRAPRREPAAVAVAGSAAPATPVASGSSLPASAAVTASAAVPTTADSVRDFGLSESDLLRRDADRGADAPPKSITGTIRSVSRDGYDRFVVTLDDGQVWAQTEQKSGAYPRPGDSVTITRGPMGGFGLRSERFGTVRVRRLK